MGPPRFRIPAQRRCTLWGAPLPKGVWVYVGLRLLRFEFCFFRHLKINKLNTFSHFAAAAVKRGPSDSLPARLVHTGHRGLPGFGAPLCALQGPPGTLNTLRHSHYCFLTFWVTWGRRGPLAAPPELSAAWGPLAASSAAAAAAQRALPIPTRSQDDPNTIPVLPQRALGPRQGTLGAPLLLLPWERSCCCCSRC